ncbi:MAG: radical SAM protein [Myxococcales bacterium FL481]|nr:MAG: radical SAM protein [Myxococcales bacterium FL481]
MPSRATEGATIRARVEREHVIVPARPDAPIVLAYPSPYRAGMSSLGFLTLHRQLNAEGPGAHRAFLPDAWEPLAMPWPAPSRPILSAEALRPISSYPIIGLSVAYELEIVGVIRLLAGAGITLRAAQRRPREPVIVAGGPLSNSNPSCLLPFVDVLVCGEAEDVLPRVIECIRSAPSRRAAIEAAAALDHVMAGDLAGDGHSLPPLPALASAGPRRLPAHAGLISPDTELADMFLVEPERGCSRRCTFCVMRGETTGGMRLLDIDTPLDLIPDAAKKVGLVGAAVTDHPRLEELVSRIVEQDRGIGISSLRADRLTPTLLKNLARGGYRTITVASDGISERMRQRLDRRIHERDLLRAAELVAEHRFHRLKIYQMLGAPDERDEDVDELIRFVGELSRIARITLTFSTFVAKRNTPLDREPFVGVPTATQRLAKIQSALRRRVEIRPQPPRWAYVEYELAQRGIEGGLAAEQAVLAGGRFSDWRRSFSELEPNERAACYGNEQALARRRGLARRDGGSPSRLVVLRDG